jgi:hypothetical protein
MTAHLRCSPNAAIALREGINQALTMVERATAANEAMVGKPEKLN